MRSSWKATHTSALCRFRLNAQSFVGNAYYLRKLGTFNFTVYYYGTDEVFCYLWPGHITSKRSNEVVSYVVGYSDIIEKRNVKTVPLLSDSCGG